MNWNEKLTIEVQLSTNIFFTLVEVSCRTMQHIRFRSRWAMLDSFGVISLRCSIHCIEKACGSTARVDFAGLRNCDSKYDHKRNFGLPASIQSLISAERLDPERPGGRSFPYQQHLHREEGIASFDRPANNLSRSSSWS